MDSSTTSAASTRHLLPKTRLSHIIMHENPSQEARLRHRLERLEKDRRRARLLHEHLQRSFRADLRRKGAQWVHEDEQRILTMNLPHGHHRALKLEGPGVDVLYSSPRYDITASDAADVDRLTGPVLPVSRVARDSMQIYKVGAETLVRRLPHHFKIRPERLARHDLYRGHTWLAEGAGRSDSRFEGLERFLTVSDLRLPPISHTGRMAPPPRARELREKVAAGFGDGAEPLLLPPESEAPLSREASDLSWVGGLERQRTVSNLLLRRSPRQDTAAAE